jgi:RNA polymerase sigma-70 factor (ECF subfamily)
MTSDDEQLARGLAAGSSAAWHALYDAFAEAVWRCVARRVGPHAAEVADIVQETFLAAARSARTFDPARGSLWGWLSGIARRQTALHFRRKQTRPEAEGEGGWGSRSEPRTEDLPSGGWGSRSQPRLPEEVLVLAETAAAVRQVLSGLPVDYETLLVGKYQDGLSLDELAQAEDCTVDAVSSKLARARRAFREAYERVARHSVAAILASESRAT